MDAHSVSLMWVARKAGRLCHHLALRRGFVVCSARIPIASDLLPVRPMARKKCGNEFRGNVAVLGSCRRVIDQEIGWEAWTRTRIARSRVWSPTNWTTSQPTDGPKGGHTGEEQKRIAAHSRGSGQPRFNISRVNGIRRSVNPPQEYYSAGCEVGFYAVAVEGMTRRRSGLTSGTGIRKQRTRPRPGLCGPQPRGIAFSGLCFC